MRNDPRTVNLVLVRADDKRRYVGSVIVRGGSTWFKTQADAGYLHRNRNALGLNTAVIEQLKTWRVRDVYFLLGSGQGRQRYKTTVATLERLGTVSNAGDGWGWNVLLPLEQWTEDRSTFSMGFVPDGQDLCLPVSEQRPEWLAELTENVTTREREVRTFADSAKTPAQLGLFDAAREVA